jgi:hypothetical protein
VPEAALHRFFTGRSSHRSALQKSAGARQVFLMLREEHRNDTMRRYDSNETATLIDNRQRRFAMANRAPCRHLLIDAGGYDRSFTIHERFHGGVCRRPQELFDRHHAEERLSLTYDDVTGAFIAPPHQQRSNVADPLATSGQRHAGSRMFGSSFESQLGLTLGWSGGVDSGHPASLVSNSTFDRGSLSPTYIKPFDALASGGKTGDWLAALDDFRNWVGLGLEARERK